MSNDVNIDNLTIRISANAKSATDSLKSLTTALKKVKGALEGTKDSVTVSESFAKNLKEMNGALKGISTTSTRKLQKLANALNDYADACKRIKNVGSVSKKIEGAQNAINKAKEKSAPKAEVPTLDDEAVSSGGVSEGAIASWQAFSDATGSASDKLKIVSASLKNVTNKIKGFGDRVKKLTNDLFGLGKSSDRLMQFFHSIGRIAVYRAIRSAIKAVTDALSEGLENAYLYSQQTEGFGRLADAMDHLKSVTAQMVNQLGAFWAELRYFIQPAIEWLIEKVRQLAEFLTELFAGLNGSDVYQYALLEDLKWKEATEDVKKYKQQLLGLDELNNLTTRNDANNNANDATTKYELRPVRESFQNLGAGLKEIKKTINDAYKEIGNLAYLPMGMVALGSMLLFAGHPFLGLGLIVKGAEWTVEELEENDDLRQKIDEHFEKYHDLYELGSFALAALGTILLFTGAHNWPLGLGLIFAGVELHRLASGETEFEWEGLKEAVRTGFEGYEEFFEKAGKVTAAIGLILLFVPGQFLLGLGLILAGVTLSALSENLGEDFSWNGLLDTIGKKFDEYRALFDKAGSASVAIGMILLFIPGQRLLGLGLIAGGIVLKSLAKDTGKIEWESIYSTIHQKFEAIKRWVLVASAAMTVLGLILLFIPGLRGVGVALLKAGVPVLFASAFTIDWGGLFQSLKDAWAEIENWFNNTVVVKVEKGVGKVEELLNWDINKDGRIGYKAPLPTHTSSSGDEHGGTSGKWVTPESLKQDGPYIPSVSDFSPVNMALTNGTNNKAPNEYSVLNGAFTVREGSIIDKLGLFPKALGGVVSQGSLFYAGEAGAEFVGNIGTTSAVANTDQMTDAIYKAAYMGMSRALQENGGMSGYEPATTDDLFIAMRKKASAYNRQTGSSAFA